MPRWVDATKSAESAGAANPASRGKKKANCAATTAAAAACQKPLPSWQRYPGGGRQVEAAPVAGSEKRRRPRQRRWRRGWWWLWQVGAGPAQAGCGDMASSGDSVRREELVWRETQERLLCAARTHSSFTSPKFYCGTNTLFVYISYRAPFCNLPPAGYWK